VAGDLVLIKTCDLSDALAGRHWASAGVGLDGGAVFLLARDEDVPALDSRFTSVFGAPFRASRTRRRLPAELLFHDGTNSWEIALDAVTVAHPHVQPLPDGEILLVGARCRRHRDSTVERNAHVYGPDGALRRELVFGDGIQDVQVASSGDIWVSYFDDGIFGNYGWGGRVSAQPVGRSGLVCFDARGNATWEFAPVAGLHMMADCYALNVARNVVWAYYYTEFPLVRIGAGRAIRWWSTPIRGARALAVDGRRVLLCGGYAPDRGRCVLAELRDGNGVTTVDEYRFVLSDGLPIDGVRVIGRGPVLHAFTEDAWYQVDLHRL
jgi:hypothetical protein